eukprot:8964458-Karenia_brevis.AAC.1
MEAAGATHPFDKRIVVPPRLAKLWHNMAASGPQWVIEHRAKMLSHYRDVRTKLEDQEKRLHSSLNLSVESVV